VQARFGPEPLVKIRKPLTSPNGAAEWDQLRMPQSLSAVYIHLIFSTKDRTPLVPDHITTDFYSYIGGIARNEKCVSLATGGMADHIHLLVSLSREIAIAELVRTIKAASSKWMHDHGRHDFQWQAGYGAFSVSRSNLNEVRAYIARQKEHHLDTSFREEYLTFLKRHDIEFDERYLWD
jgi:REP element-mobilizing transposase RayT